MAVMARYNPFFEHAGLTKIAESKPDSRILEAMEKLRAFASTKGEYLPKELETTY